MRLLHRDDSGRISLLRDIPEIDLFRYPYAILSHTWGPDEDEVTYDNIVQGTGTSKLGFNKVCFCADQASRNGLEYFGIDTCCIKEGSAERSKSLISMYRWYSKAAICYVYLTDVADPATSGEATLHKDFQRSRWFTRGWTLQELLAPQKLAFFSRQGVFLGDRTSLAGAISEITGIPKAALEGQALSSFSMTERWRWQEGRDTREPEDLIYSLFGIFDVSMPVFGADVVAGKHLESFSLGFFLTEVVETPKFVARERELNEIRQNLQSDGPRRYVVLHGLGGIGKTQLAIAYAMRFKNVYTAALWVNAISIDPVHASFTRIMKHILRGQPAESKLQIDDDIANTLRGPSISGCTDSNSFNLRQFFPDAYQGSILITSRSSDFRIGHSMRVQKLTEKSDALEILETTSGRRDLSNDDDALRLADKLDGLPLALATAGAYLSQSSITLAKYLEHFEHSWAKLQRLSPTLMTYENRTLYSTWQMTLHRVTEINPISAELIRMWAFLNHQDIWYELLAEKHPEAPRWLQDLTEDELTFQACMDVLCRHGLVEPNIHNEHGVESVGYNVHGCVHSWMMSVLNEEPSAARARAALQCVVRHAFPHESPDRPARRRRLLPHVRQCLTYVRQKFVSDADQVSALQHFGCLLMEQGKHNEAEDLCNRSLAILENAAHPDHISILSALHNIGFLYLEQGHLQRSLDMFTRALRGREDALGMDHESTLVTVESLADVLVELGRPSEAQSMYLRALRGREKTLGVDHTATLNVYDHLGSLYAEQRRPEDARIMYMHALHGRERTLGPSHKLTLDSIENLGSLFLEQAMFFDAAQAYRRTLKGRQEAQFPDYVAIVDSARDLGNALTQLGNPVEGEEVYLEMLQKLEKSMRSDDTTLLYAYQQLGSLYVLQENLPKAEEALVLALKECMKAPSADHRDNVLARGIVNDLGSLYEQQSRWQDAEALYVQSLENQHQIRGSDNIWSITIAYSLSQLYFNQGSSAKAVEVSATALGRSEGTLGSAHALTLALRRLWNKANAAVAEQGK